MSTVISSGQSSSPLPLVLTHKPLLLWKASYHKSKDIHSPRPFVQEFQSPTTADIRSGRNKLNNFLSQQLPQTGSVWTLLQHAGRKLCSVGMRIEFSPIRSAAPESVCVVGVSEWDLVSKGWNVSLSQGQAGRQETMEGVSDWWLLVLRVTCGADKI